MGAALSGSQWHGIIAVYYYLRCLTSEQTFDGAEGNLKKILDKATSIGSNSANVGDARISSDINRQMIGSMMSLFQNLLYEESTKNLSNLCRKGLEDVISSLYQENSLSSQASTHLTLSILLVKEKCCKNKVKAAMINAFLLAWLTHLTTKILADMYSNLFGPDAVMDIFEQVSDQGADDKKDE